MGMSERGSAEMWGRCGRKGRKKGPVVMSERGCTDMCGRCGRKGKGSYRWKKGPVVMSERGCADVCGWHGRKGQGGNGWGDGPAGMSERGCANVCRWRKGMDGNGWISIIEWRQLDQVCQQVHIVTSRLCACGQACPTAVVEVLFLERNIKTMSSDKLSIAMTWDLRVALVPEQ